MYAVLAYTYYSILKYFLVHYICLTHKIVRSFLTHCATYYHHLFPYGFTVYGVMVATKFSLCSYDYVYSMCLIVHF